MSKRQLAQDNEQSSVTTERGLSNALSKLLGRAPTVASVIIGLSVFAYAVGWLHARSYFGGFGASWIVSELTPTTLLGFSGFPLGILLFFIYLGVTDLMENKTRYKGTFFILRHGRWFAVLLLALGFTLKGTRFNVVSDIIGIILIFVFTLLAAAAIEAILVRLQDKEFTWQLGNIYLTYAVVFFGLYFLPTQIGETFAKHDRNPSRSSLPQVVLKDSATGDFRLLAANGERFYVVALDTTDAFPPVMVVGVFDVNFVKKVEKSK